MPAKPNPSPPASVAREPKGVADLCRIADELADLLDEETRLLHAMRLDAIAPLQADKAHLTKLCGRVLKTIDPAAPLAPALRERWHIAAKRLGDAALANEMALRVGRDATDQLVSAIIGQIDTQRGPRLAYAPPQAAAVARQRPAALSGVALDRRL